MRKRSFLIAAAAASASLTSAVFAADRVWTGLGDGTSWNTAANWDGGVTVPADGDNLLFPDVASGQSVDTQASRILGTLTFNAPDAYSINNNALTLGGTTTQNGAGAVALNSALSTGGNPQVFNAAGNGVVSLNGVLSGAGGLTFNAGKWSLTNAGSSFTGAVLVNTGATLEAAGTPTAANVVVNSNATTHFGNGSGAPGAVTINGGTIKLTTAQNGTVAGNISLGRPVTFGVNGGTLDITNTVGGTLGGGVTTISGTSVGGGGGNLPVVLTGPGTAVIKFNGGQFGLSSNNPANGDWGAGNNALRVASFTGASPTTPIRFELTNGALQGVGTEFQGLTAPVVWRGVVGGNSSESGLGHSIGKIQLTGGATNVAGFTNVYQIPGGVTFQDTFQVSTANNIQTLDANVTVDGTASGHAGNVNFSGRGTGGGDPSTTNAFPLMLGGPGALGLVRTFSVLDGGTAIFDNRVRLDVTHHNGIQVNMPVTLAAGGKLRLHQSFAFSADTNHSGYLEFMANVTGNGTTAKESVIDVTVPVRGSGDALATLGGYTFTASNLVVNGSGLGGLRINGGSNEARIYTANNPTNELALPFLVDTTTNVQKLLGVTATGTARAILSPTRLAALTGTGGYLTIAPANEAFPFPAGGEWGGGVLVGLKIVDSNPSGADLILPSGTSWSHNVHVAAGANLVASAVTLGGGSLSGFGSVTSGTGANAVTFNAGASINPGASAGVLTFTGGAGANDVSLKSNSILGVEIASSVGTPLAGVDYDQVAVVGGANGGVTNLNADAGLGALLTIALSAASDPALGTKYAIVLNDANHTLAGTFAGLPDGALLVAPNAGNGGSPVGFTVKYNVDGGDGSANDVVLTVAPAPEPATIGLLGMGALGVFGRRRRR